MTRPSRPDYEEELALLVAFGHRYLPTCRECSNLASRIGASQYIAIADEIASRLKPGSKILDWGAGWGQNSFLLRRRGLNVVAYDIEDHFTAMDRKFLLEKISYIVRPDVQLPFLDESFHAILGCGVLEHVPSETMALGELHRVLKPGGFLFIYHLPNRASYMEHLARVLGRFHHARTYTRRDAGTLLTSHGFQLLECRPFHLLPRNIFGSRLGLIYLLDRWVKGFDALDAFLVALPGLRYFATAWAVIGRR